MLTQNTETKVDTGTVNLKNFAIVDEEEPWRRWSRGSPDWAAATAIRWSSTRQRPTSVRRKDRIQIVEAIVAGDSVGGSGEGFIYTDEKRYDIVGTFVPMFGINNALRQACSAAATMACGASRSPCAGRSTSRTSR